MFRSRVFIPVTVHETTNRVSFNSGETLEKHQHFEPSFSQGKMIKSFHKPYLSQSLSLGTGPFVTEAHGGNNCPTPLLALDLPVWDLSGWVIKAALHCWCSLPAHAEQNTAGALPEWTSSGWAWSWTLLRSLTLNPAKTSWWCQAVHPCGWRGPGSTQGRAGVCSCCWPLAAQRAAPCAWGWWMPLPICAWPRRMLSAVASNKSLFQRRLS